MILTLNSLLQIALSVKEAYLYRIDGAPFTIKENITRAAGSSFFEPLERVFIA